MKLTYMSDMERGEERMRRKKKEKKEIKRRSRLTYLPPFPSFFIFIFSISYKLETICLKQNRVGNFIGFNVKIIGSRYENQGHS